MKQVFQMRSKSTKGTEDMGLLKEHNWCHQPLSGHSNAQDGRRLEHFAASPHRLNDEDAMTSAKPLDFAISAALLP